MKGVLCGGMVSVIVHTGVAEGQEGVGRDAGAAHKGAAWCGATIASPLRALQCPTTASLPERIGPASKRESSSTSDLTLPILSSFFFFLFHSFRNLIVKQFSIHFIKVINFSKKLCPSLMYTFNLLQIQYNGKVSARFFLPVFAAGLVLARKHVKSSRFTWLL